MKAIREYVEENGWFPLETNGDDEEEIIADLEELGFTQIEVDENDAIHMTLPEGQKAAIEAVVGIIYSILVQGNDIEVSEDGKRVKIF